MSACVALGPGAGKSYAYTDEDIRDLFVGRQVIGESFLSGFTIQQLQRALLLAASGRFFLSSADAAAVESYIRNWARRSDRDYVVQVLGEATARRILA